MITSPCKTCKNLRLPKDICSKDCEKIKNIQSFQVSMTNGPYMAVDCTDGSRYRLCLPTTRHSYG